jgi:hypothetical protein
MGIRRKIEREKITSGRKVSDAYQDAGDVYMSQNTVNKHEIQKKG